MNGLWFLGRKRPPKCSSYGCQGNAHLALTWILNGDRVLSRVCAECAEDYLANGIHRGDLMDFRRAKD